MDTCDQLRLSSYLCIFRRRSLVEIISRLHVRRIIDKKELSNCVCVHKYIYIYIWMIKDEPTLELLSSLKPKLNEIGGLMYFWNAACFSFSFISMAFSVM